MQWTRTKNATNPVRENWDQYQMYLILPDSTVLPEKALCYLRLWPKQCKDAVLAILWPLGSAVSVDDVCSSRFKQRLHQWISLRVLQVRNTVWQTPWRAGHGCGSIISVRNILRCRVLSAINTDEINELSKWQTNSNFMYQNCRVGVANSIHSPSTEF